MIRCFFWNRWPILAALLLLVVLAGAGYEAAAQEGTLRVAFISEGAVNDGGWNAGALEGLELIREELGAQVAFSEKVGPAEMEQVIRTYARQGFHLVFGHGFAFSEPMQKLAPQFPNTTFVVVNGDVTGPNLVSTNFKFGELGYFTGMTAGLTTKTNKIGIVASVDAPPVVADVDTFKEGVAAVNPDAEVMVSYVGSWEDLAKAREAGEAQLAAGADILLVIGNAFSIGVFELAKSRGAMAIGWAADQNFMAPDTVITSGVQTVPSVYLYIAKLYAEGRLEPKIYSLGMKDGAQSLGVFNDKVSQATRDRVNQAIQDYLEGRLVLNLRY